MNFSRPISKSHPVKYEKSLAELRGLSQNLKEWVLEKLYQLSLADDFLHVDEKGFLEDVNKYWGLRASFGKDSLTGRMTSNELLKQISMRD